MQPTPTIGQRIKTVRGELSQKAFGARVGLSQTAVTALENDQSEPRLGTFSRIVEAFRINPDWLRTGTGAMRVAADAPPPAAAPAPTNEAVSRLLDQLSQQSQEHRAELTAAKKEARSTFEVTTRALQFTLETMKTSITNERQTVLELKHEIYHLRLAAGQRQPTPEEQEYFDQQAAKAAQQKGKPAGFKSYEPQNRASYCVAA